MFSCYCYINFCCEWYISLKKNFDISNIVFMLKKKYVQYKKKTSYNETTDISLRLSPEMHITCLNIYMFYCASWVGKSWYIFVRRCRTLWFFALRIEISLPLNVNQKVSNHLGLIESFLCLWKMLTRFFKKCIKLHESCCNSRTQFVLT